MKTGASTQLPESPASVDQADKLCPSIKLSVSFREFIFARRLELGLLSTIPAALLVMPGEMGHADLRIALSAALVACGLAVRVWAGGSAGKHTGGSEIEAPQLATGGPYAYVRNPIYLGTILIGLGMVGLIGDARLFPLCVLTFAALYATIIPAEEKFLRNTFGMDYERYVAEVPRMRPRLTKYPDSRKLAFNWGILKGEGRIALILAIVYGLLHLAAFAKRALAVS